MNETNIKRNIFGAFCLFLTFLLCACGREWKDGTGYSDSGRDETAESPIAERMDAQMANQQEKAAEERESRTDADLPATDTLVFTSIGITLLKKCTAVILERMKVLN